MQLAVGQLACGRQSLPRRPVPPQPGCSSKVFDLQALPARAPGARRAPLRRARPGTVQCRSSETAPRGATGEPDPDAPKPNLLQRVFAPLSNFGYGSTSIWQGGVGLFILTGIGACASGISRMARLFVRRHEQLR